MGHNSFVYLDDGFGSQPERTSAVAAAFIQRKELDSSGLLVNEEKSHWVPMLPRTQTSLYDVRAKEGGKETLPMVPCGSSPVTRVSRSPLPCEKRSA